MGLTRITSDGITDGTITGTDLASNVDLVDNQKLRLGTSDDLQIYHDGSNSYLQDSGTGHLIIRSSHLQVKNSDNTELIAKFIQDGAVELYYDHQKKFETRSNGVTVTGYTYSDGVTIGNGTSEKYLAGDSNQLQMYHTGSSGNAYINNSQGTTLIGGSIVSFTNQANNAFLIKGIDGGAAELYHNGSRKFATNSVGASILSSATAELHIVGSSSGTSAGKALFKGYRNANDNGTLGELQFINQRDNDVQAKIDVVANGDTSAYIDVIASTDNNRTFRIYSGSVAFPDNNQILLGTGNDFKIYHDGTDNILQSNGLKNFIFKPKDTDVGLKIIGDGGVEAYYDNSKKFETTSAGATVTGTVTATSFSGDGSNLSGIAAFPSGTKMLFAQSAAPTGWTKDTSNNNRALRVVNGSSGGNQGGSNTFTSVFNSSQSTSGGAVSNHTLSTAQIPGHNHGIQQKSIGAGCGGNHSYTGAAGTFGCSNNSTAFNTFNTGGGSSHGHGVGNPTFNLNVAYVDVIIASKD